MEDTQATINSNTVSMEARLEVNTEVLLELLVTRLLVKVTKTASMDTKALEVTTTMAIASNNNVADGEATTDTNLTTRK